MLDMQKTFLEFERHLLYDDKPSEYFRFIDDGGMFNEVYPLTLLGDLKKIDQSPTHHPEGNVWEHTMLVVDLTAQGRPASQNARVLMWSALLHDLGKITTTKVHKGRITAYDHDKQGAVLAASFLIEFTDEKPFIQQVAQMVRWHMQMLFVVKKMPFADIQQMVREVSLDEISLLSLCDRLGRGNVTDAVRRKEGENVKLFLQMCQPYLAQHY